MGQPAEQSDALAARLASAVQAKGAWAQSAQEAAATRLRSMGLPGRRDEYWRYTNPVALTAPAATPGDSQGAQPEVFAEVDALTLTFVDGAFSALTSRTSWLLEACEIERLPDAIAGRYPLGVRPSTGRLEADAHQQRVRTAAGRIEHGDCGRTAL